jgi:hypothetical protein
MICRVNILDKNCYLSENGIRYVTMDHSFFTGYRRTVVKPDEVLVSITIPYTKEVSQKSQFVNGVSFGEILHLHTVISHYFCCPTICT